MIARCNTCHKEVTLPVAPNYKHCDHSDPASDTSMLVLPHTIPSRYIDGEPLLWKWGASHTVSFLSHANAIPEHPLATFPDCPQCKRPRAFRNPKHPGKWDCWCCGNVF